MYNLIFLNTDWNLGKASIPLERMFEYTAEDVKAQFKDGSSPLVGRIIRFPSLFLEEGTADEIARVGNITKATIKARELHFEYTIDIDIPPLTNRFIFDNRVDLDIQQNFEFSRNHWAIKDVDLYRFLLRTVRPRRQRPSVFELSEHESVDPKLISAMMPFATQFDAVYQCLQDTVAELGLYCVRADDFWENERVIQDVVSLIDKSQLIICDCTGQNPNVFYEIGIAHTLGRDVVLITQADQDIPFDLRHLRYLRYDNDALGRKKLASSLRRRLAKASIG